MASRLRQRRRPGYAYYPTQGVNTTKLYGPYGFTVSSATATTAATINQKAINAIPADQSEFNSDTELAANGYVSTTARGTVQVTVSNSAGWSSNTANNTVVLSQPGVNLQESTQGYQYWGQLSQNGAATMAGVVPGAYRMSIYELGQWGESRFDGVRFPPTRSRSPPTPSSRPRISAPRPRSGRSARPIVRQRVPQRPQRFRRRPARVSGFVRLLGQGGRPGQSGQGRLLRDGGGLDARHEQPERLDRDPVRHFQPGRIQRDQRQCRQLRQCLSGIRHRGRRSGRLMRDFLGKCISRRPPRKGPRGNTSCSRWRWPTPTPA